MLIKILNQEDFPLMAIIFTEEHQMIIQYIKSTMVMKCMVLKQGILYSRQNENLEMYMEKGEYCD